ncbi:preprotein translocase subunit SecE [Prescottella subtropica]|uniref:preprotein translocase subunit SecE n=1 Tax=Prescottella subtropica TaxID=2545757 RepID=UPI00138669C5|nr:preprotein translocase subunit SecE [Prescottella subtropica]
MSEERGKPDDSVAGSSDSTPVDDSVVSDQDAQVPAEESPTSVAPAGKPSGKRGARRTGTTELASPAVAASSVKTTKSGGKAAAKAGKAGTENIFMRLRRFLREVIAELRKVIWPNRKQMITYTSVVLVFVAFMVTFVSVLDLGFAQGVTWLFG